LDHSQLWWPLRPSWGDVARGSRAIQHRHRDVKLSQNCRGTGTGLRSSLATLNRQCQKRVLRKETWRSLQFVPECLVESGSQKLATETAIAIGDTPRNLGYGAPTKVKKVNVAF